MIYTEKQLYDFMSDDRPVKVTTKNGKVFVGKCYAYSAIANEMDFGVNQPSIEVQDTILYLSEIEMIESIPQRG